MYRLLGQGQGRVAEKQATSSYLVGRSRIPRHPAALRDVRNIQNLYAAVLHAASRAQVLAAAATASRLPVLLTCSRAALIVSMGVLLLIPVLKLFS